MTNRLVSVFLDSDMRGQHKAMANLAKRSRVDVYDLSPGHHVVFINRKLDRIKMFSANGVLSYMKVRGRINLESLKYIPQAFSGNSLEVAYSRALRSAVEERLG